MSDDTDCVFDLKSDTDILAKSTLIVRCVLFILMISRYFISHRRNMCNEMCKRVFLDVTLTT